MVANGSEPREILLDPMVAGSRGADGCEFDREVDRECSPRVEGADGCEFDREVDRECSPRVDSLDMMGSVDEPVRNSAAR